jgi:pantetheine-phosphate adenylyltransferase
MAHAAFTGSFDPPTLGHIDIIGRSRLIFDELTVVLAENRAKTALFTLDERYALMRTLVSRWDNVSVCVCSRPLLADFLRERTIGVIVRGLRGAVDFPYEYEVSLVNKGLNPALETVFIACRPEFLAVRSQTVKELASLGGDVSALVPPEVRAALRGKLR